MHAINTSDLPIGRALKVERVVAGITLTDLANALGISPGHLSHIEAGRRVASPELISRIRATVRASKRPETAA